MRHGHKEIRMIMQHHVVIIIRQIVFHLSQYINVCLSVLLKEASTLYLSHTLDIYCFEDLGMCILCIVYFAYILVVSIATTYICSLVTFSLSLHYRMLMMRHLQHKIDHSKMIHLQIHISHFFLWFPQFLIYTWKIVNNLLSSDII